MLKNMLNTKGGANKYDLSFYFYSRETAEVVKGSPQLI